ncbi:hypothetical protein E2C01_051732 [Portunus trituberculatus]|uniref:Uncharacterized protein n=1 Tax=Portunus trituberculatus TaxID=210409 RepID=A0A5B7GK52_PORTR|nr:hypothetical protein [Portunus trituberculatus]
MMGPEASNVCRVQQCFTRTCFVGRSDGVAGLAANLLTRCKVWSALRQQTGRCGQA